jgi:hypothetical protein
MPPVELPLDCVGAAVTVKEDPGRVTAAPAVHAAAEVDPVAPFVLVPDGHATAAALEPTQ